MPPRLLHSRAGLCQIFKAALDLRAVYADIGESKVVEPVQDGARSACSKSPPSSASSSLAPTPPFWYPKH
jgi:hypothetical protein